MCRQKKKEEKANERDAKPIKGKKSQSPGEKFMT
jgi:hypothetical protein